MTPQATFYHYEPLIPYGVRRFRSMNSSDTNEALRQLHHLLSCNYTDMGKYAVNHWGKHKKYKPLFYIQTIKRYILAIILQIFT